MHVLICNGLTHGMHNAAHGVLYELEPCQGQRPKPGSAPLCSKRLAPLKRVCVCLHRDTARLSPVELHILPTWRVY